MFYGKAMTIVETLIPARAISDRIESLAQEIQASLEPSSNSPLLVLCVLRGAFVFCADLVRALEVPLEIDFMQLSSYHGAKQTSGEVKMTQAPRTRLSGRDILVVEDIVDTGLSMNWLSEYLIGEQAKSVKVCSLLNKESRRIKAFKVDHVGFEIEDKFVVGYGLDFDELYRDLKDVCILIEDS